MKTLRPILLILLISLLVSTAGAQNQSPMITEVYPDTHLPYNEGEYLGINFPEPQDTTGWTISDGYRTTRLPNETLIGNVYFARLDERIIKGNHSLGSIRLSQKGDTIYLNDSSGGTVDVFTYGEGTDLNPGEGDVIHRQKNRVFIEPLGATHHRFMEGVSSRTTAFVSPDSSMDTFISYIEAAEESIHISIYEFTSQRQADELVDAAQRGVYVCLLVEGSPVGGMDQRSVSLLREMNQSGVHVYLKKPRFSRYRFMHAKFAVIDNESSIVSTQNLDDQGFSSPKSGSRGWGIVFNSPELSHHLFDVHRGDRDWRSVHGINQIRLTGNNKSRIEGSDVIETDFRRLTDTEESEIGIIVGPDQSINPVMWLIENASESIHIQQAYIRHWGERRNPLLEKVKEKAREGLKVRVHLDGRWFVQEENQKIIDELDRLRKEENLDIEARLSSTPIHTKGVVVDGDKTLVSSLNWNKNSFTNNREVGVVVESEEIAGYFLRVFESDWETSENHDGWSNTYIYLGLLIGALGLAGLLIALKPVN